jgi:hypothetical protein
MRPNCSRQLAVVWLGAHRTLIALIHEGTSPCGTFVATCTRPACAAANVRIAGSSTPPPTKSACHGAELALRASISISGPLAATNRPTNPTTSASGGQPRRARTCCPSAGSGAKRATSTPGGITRMGFPSNWGRRPIAPAALSPNAIQPSARPIVRRSNTLNGHG